MFENDIKHAMKTIAENIHPPTELKNKVFEELEFISKDGEFLGKVTVDTLELDNPMDQIICQIKPGMGKAIYIVDNNPNKVISNQTNYEHVTWNAGIKELKDGMLPYKFKIPVNVDLQEIYVMYGFEPIEESDEKELYEEAKLTGKPVIVRDLIKSNRIVGAKLICEKDDIGFEFHVLTTTKSRIHVPDINKHVIERIFVNNYEGIYLTDSTIQHLLWVVDEDGRNIQYEIRTQQGTKEWTFAMAEDLFRKL